MTSKKQRPRSVYVERLGDTLHKTDFVHVKAAWGPDKGKLKVYRMPTGEPKVRCRATWAWVSLSAVCDRRGTRW